MNDTDIEKIKSDTAEKYDGDLDTAIAAHLMGDVVISYCAGKVPAGADLNAIAAIRKEIEGPPQQRPLGSGGRLRRSAKARSRQAKKTPANTAVAGEGKLPDPRLRRSKDDLLAEAKRLRVAVVKLKLADATKKEIIAAIDAKKK